MSSRLRTCRLHCAGGIKRLHGGILSGSARVAALLTTGWLHLQAHAADGDAAGSSNSAASTAFEPEPEFLGMSVETFEDWSLKIGLTFFMGYMFFIIWKLGRDSQAGRFGTFILFIVLGFGMFGFMAKQLIAKLLGL